MSASGHVAIFSIDELDAFVAGARGREGKIVVFTNGVFDLLHPGHLRYLQASRRHGDLLVVRVNSDSSVRAIKGESRPVTPQDERREFVEGRGGRMVFERFESGYSATAIIERVRTLLH